jgi:hypothetical protein
MRCLILVFLFTLNQTPSQISGKADDKSAPSHNGTEVQTTINQKQPTVSKPHINSGAITKNQNPSNGADAETVQKPVKVSELPPVNIPNPIKISEFPPVNIPKGWTDYTYWLFSLCLVLVGALQIWLLFRTLQTTNRQADIAEQQKLQMIQAGQQTERILGQMRESTQRQLRAYICVSSALLKFPKTDVAEVQIHLKNHGQTPAYDVEGWIHTWTESYPLAVVLPEPPEGFERSREIMGPGSVRIYVNTKVISPVENLPLLGTPGGTIYAYGEVRYKDAFGESRFTKYRLIYGGSEGVRKLKPDTEGIVTALLKPDTDGNEAN